MIKSWAAPYREYYPMPVCLYLPLNKFNKYAS